MPITAEEFAEQRQELPDGGRWTELHAGQVVHLSPPDQDHGNAVLNLTKSLAGAVRPDRTGYACFELGLVTGRDPDTVWCPAVAYFNTGEPFAEADKLITEARPALVVEVASSNDRRRGLAERIERWLQWGVSAAWVVDPRDALVHVLAPPRSPRVLRGDAVLEGGEIVPGFQVAVADLFKPPAWWGKGPGAKS